MHKIEILQTFPNHFHPLFFIRRLREKTELSIKVIWLLSTHSTKHKLEDFIVDFIPEVLKNKLREAV